MPHSVPRTGSSAFPNCLLQLLFDITEFLIRPFIYCITKFAGPFLPTSIERKRPYKLALQRYVLSPLFGVLCIFILLPVIVAFLLRNLLHQCRRSFCLSVRANVKPTSPKSCFRVATANLCLLPELFAKFNNLDNTPWRAMKIGEQIISDQLDSDKHYGDIDENSVFYSNSDSSQTGKRHKHTLLNEEEYSDAGKAQMEVEVVEQFPELDFVCIQEAFDRDFSKILVKKLHAVYPWIVYDVGYNSPRLNYCGLNSGLLFASRYEVLEVRFKPFSRRCGFCSIVGKGLLMVKVLLNRSTNGKDEVGYIFNTHLQAFQGDNPVVHHQLHEILKWTEEFRKDTAEQDEKILFDLLCGDFNIDNMSPGELHLSEHELFEEYIDVCRERPGKDHHWTVGFAISNVVNTFQNAGNLSTKRGTEMRNHLLHEAQVSTPELLKQVLDDPYLRQHYLIDADLESATMDSIYNASSKRDEHGNLILSPVGGRRRIDVVLYRKQTPVTVKKYNFVTSLASLTDHIPVSATFNCT